MVKAAKHTVHEKRRDHACPHCAATFTAASNLTKHVRTVHERDHACPHCAAAFGRAGNLTTHVRTQHPDNTQDNECQHAGLRRRHQLYDII